MTNSAALGITLEQARAIVAGALAVRDQRGFKPLTVVVLDAGGHITAVEREDGSANKRFEVARGKAHGALSLGMGSRALMNRAEQQAYFITAVTQVVGPLVPVPGGVLVRTADGTLLGAVGVSGDASDSDEEAALAGIAAAGLVGHGLTPFRRSSRYESRPVARGRGQGDWSDHDEQQEASHPGAGRP